MFVCAVLCDRPPFDIFSFQSGDEPHSRVTLVSSSSAVLYYDVLTLMDEIFLPSLALMDCNCALAEEIWAILRYYSHAK